MNFNNNMAGTYRHYKFECQMIKWLNEELDQGMSAMIPSKFSKIFTFLISYPNTNIGYDIHEVMVKKVLNNVGQYSIYDCYIVSRGLNIAFLNRKNKTLTIFLDQYVSIVFIFMLSILIYLLVNSNFFFFIYKPYSNN